MPNTAEKPNSVDVREGDVCGKIKRELKHEWGKEHRRESGNDGRVRASKG